MEKIMVRIETPQSRRDTLCKAGRASSVSGGVQLPKGTPPDPLRVLEPSKKKLQSLEAQRIMAVFEDAMRRVEMVSLLPFVLSSLERFSILLGSELLQLLQNHKNLQEEYQNTTLDRSSGGQRLPMICVTDTDGHTTDHETKDSELWKRKDSIREAIKCSLRNVLRGFRQNPKAVEAILGCKSDIGTVPRHFCETMRSLEVILKERLLTTPQEELGRKRCLVAVMEREQKTNAILERLETRYNDAVRDKQREIQKRNIKITALSNELSLIERMAHETQRRNLTDASKQCVLEMKNSSERQANNREEILRLRMQTDSMRKEFRENETSMRKRKFKMATEVYNWVQKYDADLGARQEEYDLIEKLHEEEKKELAELETHFNKLAETYDAIMEERRLAQEETERKAREMAIAVKGVTRLQALWRGFKVRKTLKGDKGKKGGKKGKK